MNNATGGACSRECAVTKPYWQKCKRGKLLKSVMRDSLPADVLVLWGANRKMDDARLRLVDAGKQYCIARCGGCPLTEGYVPPK